jgi:hypothetical protein
MFSQITTIQTLTYDSVGRDYVFQFPTDDGTVYEKITMEYSMRCKNGLISTQGAPNDQGCGEWDYSCNTFLVDSSKTDSIKSTHDSHVISGFSGTEYPYTTQATYNYHSYNQYDMVYNFTILETSASIGSGSINSIYPFNSAQKVSKTQYLWTVSELTTAGLIAGDISSLKLNVTNSNNDLNFLRIKIKQISQNILDEINPETSGFTEVYFKNTQLVNGINQFNFYNNFTWDGTSNLLVEFSYTNSTSGTNNEIESEDVGSNMALISSDDDGFLEFSAIGRVDISNSDYSSVGNEITVEFWAFGNADILPVNTSGFEATDNQNRRQVHAHLPWSNSGIYWDCGNDGNYDRIDKTATSDEIKGQWHHWAFVKNATTGNMNIYLDGEVWMSGTGKTNSIEIESFKFGSNVAGTYPYYGYIDNFSVWNKELTQTEIQDWMYKDVDASHPEYSNLINYFALNDGTGSVIHDDSPNNISGMHDGVATWKSYRGNDIFKNFTTSTIRPNITFVQGSYTTTLNTINVLDSVLNNPNMITQYQIVGSDLEIVDTNLYYQAGNMYVYDETNTIVDTFFVIAEDTINIVSLQYYNKYPSVFELMSFVTPYGLYLDLGPDGKTWSFDVTDFAPILKGSKRLYLTGGVYQENLDIRFIFKEGTPPRNVVDIQQIWRAGSQRNYNDIMSDKYFEPRDFQLNPSASTYKIRTAVTGHGQEGEFIPRLHYINLDGGSNEFQWQGWKECADNPIYPQGGTWIYDRAGWCPGAPTDLNEYEITSNVTPGGNVNIDYGVTSGSGDSRYIVNCQLVSYGNPNLSLDAELVDIQRPSDKIEYGRVNPVCYNPTVRIRNTGSIILTSLKITYGVDGGITKEYSWTGNLDFNETEIVALPIQEASFWIGDGLNTFTASISLPNGSTDQYLSNNTQTSNFILPDIYTQDFYIFLETNNYASENSYVIKDHEGNVVFTRSSLTNNTYYYDTLNLATGCYTLEMTDSGNNGLEFWANTSQGVGALKFRSTTTWQIYKTIDPDFGKSTSYSFIVGDITYINGVDNAIPTIQVYPNPTKDKFFVDVDLEILGDINISIYGLTGRKIIEKEFDNTFTASALFDLSNENEGVYLCKIKSKDKVYVKKISLLK